MCLGQLMLPVRMAAWTENFTCHKHVLSSLKAFRTQHIETKFRQIWREKKKKKKEKGRKKKKEDNKKNLQRNCGNHFCKQSHVTQNAKQLKNNEQKVARSQRVKAKKTLHCIYLLVIPLTGSP